MHNNLAKTLTYSDLVTDFAMGGPDEGDGIINLDAMIKGGTNFKLMYNAITRIGVNRTTSTVSDTTNTTTVGDPLFCYGGTVDMYMINQSQDEILEHNVIQGTKSGQSISSSILTANGASTARTLPVLTPLFCNDEITTCRWESDDDIYYFIPSSATAATAIGWIGLGVKSTCWSHDNPNISRWIIGKRLHISRAYNYIFKVRKVDDSTLPSHTWTQYTYNNGGNQTSTKKIEMDGHSVDIYDYLQGSPEIDDITINSVNNRLSGNFYDIVNAFSYWGKSIIGEEQYSSVFLCNTRGPSGTSPTIDNKIIAHAVPHYQLGSGTTIDGTKKIFQLYQYISYLDLNWVYYESGRDLISYLVLYPGFAKLSVSGGSSSSLGPQLQRGSVIDLDVSSISISARNNYNNNFVTYAGVNNYGCVMYVIPPFDSYHNNLNVYCNFATTSGSTTNNNWGVGTANNIVQKTYFDMPSYTLEPGYSYIIECWSLGSGSSKMKVYKYDSYGECVDVSETLTSAPVS